MLNMVMLIGNLGGDPELRYTQGGSQVATFTLATTERWKGQDGKKDGQQQQQWDPQPQRMVPEGTCRFDEEEV